MTKDLKRFFLTAAILLVIVLVVSQIIFSTFFETFCFPGRIISIIFVWLATCASHYWLMKTVTDYPKAFNRVFLMQTTIKLLLYIAYIAGYLILYRQHGVPFTVHFFVNYIIFAIFDVSLILKFVRENTGQVPGSIKKNN